jgi:selenocysteine-specific elongation factor
MTQSHASKINITLGTAGHIDHGKTALIKLLTGCETDRLKQEKERGMSIELGFAPFRMGDLEVGIVDVPGHENFVKTMVAGATGIDGVIFVVAADDGIMPQTREHLDILTLLGVQHGMVSLTKIDIVAPERVETVKTELEQYLRGTFLENVPVCPMSAITGAGFDGFYTALKDMIKGISPRSTEGIFRMPVERMFSVKGFGTVVSGIPASGLAKTGDELILLPSGNKSRIKAIQVYGHDAEVVKSGQCAALNLPQVDYKSVQRGQVLTQGDYFKPAVWFACTLRLLELEKQKLKNGSKVKFHTGTSEVTGRIYLMESNVVAARQEALMQIRTEHPIVAGPGDRYILRSLSPVQTVGGGRIIEPIAHRLKQSKKGVLVDIQARAEAVLQPDLFVEYCIQNAPNVAAKINDIALRVKLEKDKVGAIISQLIDQGKVQRLTSDLSIHTRTLEDAIKGLRQHVDQFHKEKSDSPGIEKERLQELCGFERKIFDGLLARLLEQKKIVLRKDRIALPSHTEQFDPRQQQLLNAIESQYANRLFSPPKIEDITVELRKSTQEVVQTIHLLLEQQVLVRVEQDLYFHTDAIKEAKRRTIEYIQTEGKGQLESVQFKYLLDTTRKYAIPLLDYMDKIGVTCRVGNTRYLK